MNSPGWVPVVVDGAAGSHQRLAGDEAPEDPLALFVRTPSAENIDLDRFEVEEGDEIVEGLGHATLSPVFVDVRRQLAAAHVVTCRPGVGSLSPNVS
jgi:hypothetical protein